jgi:hypothetical protein
MSSKLSPLKFAMGRINWNVEERWSGPALTSNAFVSVFVPTADPVFARKDFHIFLACCVSVYTHYFTMATRPWVEK